MDNFHTYLKKQLLEYVEAERSKGVPLEEIEKVLMNAGHKKNLIDEVLAEIKKEAVTGKETKHKDPVEKDMVSMLKEAFAQFTAQTNTKGIKAAKKDLEKTDTKEVVKEVIQEAEIREERTVLEGVVFFVYLIIIALVTVFTAGSTDSALMSVIIGFLPAILNCFISFLAVKLADNVPLYVAIPVAISSIFYAVGTLTPLPLFRGMDIASLSVVNFLIGLVFNVLIVYIRFMKPPHMREKIIKPAVYHHPKSKKDEQAISELKKEFDM